MRVEIEETIKIGSGATLHVLDGVALMAEEMQKNGLTLNMSFSSKDQAEQFVLVFSGYYGGKCDARGKIVFIKGRE